MSRDSYTPNTIPLHGAGLPAMRVRELRVTDIRCRECGAVPGEDCAMQIGRIQVCHWVRANEYARLKCDGWQWQEVDPYDAGAKER